jgi:predicted RND superfamily exporter protein
MPLELESFKFERHIESIALWYRVEDQFGSFATTIIMIKGTNVTSIEVLTYAMQLIANLSTIDGILAIDSVFSYYELPMISYLNYTALKHWITEDRKLMCIYLQHVYSSYNPKSYKAVTEIQHVIESIEKPIAVKDVGLTGSPVIARDINRIVERDRIFTGAIALIGIIIVLIVGFNKLRTPLLIGTPVLIAIIWTVGLMQLIGLKFSYYTFIGTLPIIFGIGVDFGIHFIYRYRTERELNRKMFVPAIETTLSRTGKALATAAGTTACAFLTLNLSGSGLVANFGTIMAIGVIMSLLATIIILPIILHAELLAGNYMKSYQRYQKG